MIRNRKLINQKSFEMVFNCTTLWVKISADDILKYFFLFYQKIEFDISCKLSPLETICMKCQTYFLGKIRKNTIILSFAEYAQIVVKVKN